MHDVTCEPPRHRGGAQRRRGVVTHVTATWLCAETWHRAPTRQPVPRKGDGRVCGPAGVDLFSVPAGMLVYV